MSNKDQEDAFFGKVVSTTPKKHMVKWECPVDQPVPALMWFLTIFCRGEKRARNPKKIGSLLRNECGLPFTWATDVNCNASLNNIVKTYPEKFGRLGEGVARKPYRYFAIIPEGEGQ